MERKSTLKSRAFNTQEQWMNVWNNYDKYVSIEEMKALESKTLKEMLEVTNGKKCGYAYSGGKDSVVLSILCNKIGIYDGICAISSLFFDKSIEHIKSTLPQGLTLVDTGQDMQWLFENQEQYLFSDDMFQWYKIGHLQAQKEFHQEHDLDLMLKGKRRQDGNNIGTDLIRTNSRTGNEYNPIRDWTHEEVIAYMRYHGKTLSEFYWTEYGFHFGDVEWPSMNLQKGMSVYDMWDYIYSFQPSAVIKASEGIKSAKKYLILKGE